MKQKKRILFFLLISLLSLLIFFYFIKPQQNYYAKNYVKIQGIYFLHPVKVDHFELINHQGYPLTENDLKNHWNFIFFGFTNCNSVCPVTLAALNRMYQILQNKLSPKDLPQIIFISIDPEGDSLTNLKKYVAYFNPHFIGAKGTPDETKKIAKAFHIVVEKTYDTKTMRDTFNHSAEIILINPEAKIQAYFTYPPQSDHLAEDYFHILNKHLYIYQD